MVYSGDSFYEQYLQHNGMNKNADLSYIDVEPGTIIHFKYLYKRFENGKWRYYYKQPNRVLLGRAKEFYDTKITGEAYEQHREDVLRKIKDDAKYFGQNDYRSRNTVSQDLRDLKEINDTIKNSKTLKKTINNISNTVKEAANKLINSVLSKFKKK